jgi:uncharacterized membrane protein
MGYSSSSLKKDLILFLMMGFLYYRIEILWRGYSHWSMVIVGGLCGLLIGQINEVFTWNMALWKQQSIATVIVLALEFISGCILNIWLKLGIWDYSLMPFNVLGQVCLIFAFLWYWLSLACIILDDLLRWKLFGEYKPHYKLF